MNNVRMQFEEGLNAMNSRIGVVTARLSMVAHYDLHKSFVLNDSCHRVYYRVREQVLEECGE